MQQGFGNNQRLPNSLLSDDPIAPGLLSENPMTDLKMTTGICVEAAQGRSGQMDWSWPGYYAHSWWMLD